MGFKQTKQTPALSISSNGEVQVFRPYNITTLEAAAYLEAKGYPVTPSTLEVWRSKAMGPRYRKIGRRVFYYDQR
jgi:hypothetical protein